MITQTLPRMTTIPNPFDYPVAASRDDGAEIFGAREWSGEVDSETLAEGLAEPYPHSFNTAPEIAADLFEQIYTWFLA